MILENKRFGLDQIGQRQETPKSESLWEQVGECFDTNDGSLPSIEINNLSAEGVTSIYAMLRGRSKLSGRMSIFCGITDEKELHVDSVPNAAALVASEQAEAFHICIVGVIAAGVELPELGVFVFPDSIDLDYRMGSEWGPAQVTGFFELLRDCCEIDPNASVVPAKCEGPPFPERFIKAWNQQTQA